MSDTSVHQGAKTAESGAGQNSPEPLMDIDELAGYLNVPKSWIYEQSRLKKRNGFPVLKCGKYLRFQRQAVIDWMVKQV